MAESLSTGFANMICNAIKTELANCVIGIYGGTKPANADTTEGSAPLLAWITLDGGVFTSGSATNGLNFDTITDGYLYKKASENWKFTGLAAAGLGTVATWFRIYENTVVTGDTTSSSRLDGNIGSSSSYEMQLSNTTIVEDGPGTVSTFYYRQRKA